MRFRSVQIETHRLFPPFHFYRDVLEMEVSEDSALQFTVHTPHTKLIFRKSKDPLKQAFYHFAFNIPSNKIEEAFQWIKEKTELLWLDEYKSYIADFSDWRAKSVYFFDPAGNVVEIISRFDLQDHETDPFHSGQIRSISEIGIVLQASSWQTSIDQLLSKYQLSYFNKQPPLRNFCAIGDDHGLFIVVPEQRNWYPCSNKEAGIFPLRLEFVSNGNLYYWES